MNSRAEVNDLGRRLIFSKIVACIAFGLLGVRLWFLQGIWGGYYRDLSENNRTRTIRTAAPRGTMYDREGRVLVRNRPAFDVALLLEDTPNVNETIYTLAQLTGRDPEQVFKQFRSSKKNRPFEPKVVLSDVTREELAKVKVNTHLLPGVIINPVPTRAYPNGALASQIFGYIREITKDQLAKVDASYKQGDFVGQTGLEKQYEEYLHGRSGYVQVEVDARGTRKGELGIVDNVVGQDLHLTLDLDLQRAAERALLGHRGAVVAIEPSTGEILALVSSPTFDANLFSGQVLLKDWEVLNSDIDKPLTNRALASAYPPGSTIKLLYAVAGLNEGVISPDSKVFCPGYFQFGKRKYRCHSKTGHGTVDLRSAIRMSCNVYFFQLGQSLGIERMHRYLDLFGLGTPTGIDIPAEEGGIAPSPEWKRARYDEKWYPGDSVPVSIGQGYLITTPIQMANFSATLANGGALYQPMLVKRVINPLTGEITQFTPTLRNRLPIPPSIFKTIREYSSDVVNAERGTGKRAAIPGIMVGGKTGTAQVRAGLMKNPANERHRDHAWFVALAPVENPTIAMAVIVENSGAGGMFAAPVAREVMVAHFLKRGMLKPEDLEKKTDKPGAKTTPPQKREPVQPERVIPPVEAVEPDADAAGAAGEPVDVPDTDGTPEPLPGEVQPADSDTSADSAAGDAEQKPDETEIQD